MSKRVTIKDLAAELNLSLSSINAALHNKPGVSEETRKQVLYTADVMGYKINRIAQSMARKAIHIGIIVRNFFPGFDDYAQMGIEHELANLYDYNITGIFHIVQRDDTEDMYLDVINSFMKQQVDAIITFPILYRSPGHDKFVDFFNNIKIPVIFLFDNVIQCKKLCTIRNDGLLSGKLAAEYLSKTINPGKSAAILFKSYNVENQVDRLTGFKNVLNKTDVLFNGAYENHDDPDIAYLLTKKILSEDENLCGLYVATANWLGVCRAIEELELSRKISLIVTDTNEYIEKKMDDGIISACLYQNPAKIGSMAVKTIYESLVLNNPVEPEILVIPQLLLKNNLNAIIFI